MTTEGVVSNLLRVEWQPAGDGTSIARFGAGWLIQVSERLLEGEHPAMSCAVTYVPDIVSHINEPDDCARQSCEYYSCYLAYGGPELTHEGYHAAAEEGRRHFENCRSALCRVCMSFEQRLRV